MKYSTKIQEDDKWYRNLPVRTHLLEVNSRSLLGRIFGQKGQLQEIPLGQICDYEETTHSSLRELVLYVFDPDASIGEWTRVRKLKPMNTTSLSEKDHERMMQRIKEVVETNLQLGVRRKNRFYTAMPVNFGMG